MTSSEWDILWAQVGTVGLWVLWIVVAGAVIYTLHLINSAPRL